MAANGRWPLAVTGVAAITIGFTIAHSLEDFVYGIPARFGFEIAPAAALVGLAYALHAVFVALAARGAASGYLGNMAAGTVWFVAAVFDHFSELLFASPYRAGAISKLFIGGTILSSLILAFVSFAAWRASRRNGLFEYARSKKL